MHVESLAPATTQAQRRRDAMRICLRLSLPHGCRIAPTVLPIADPIRSPTSGRRRNSFSAIELRRTVSVEGLTPMDPDDYRARARRCRVAAAQSDEPLRRDFLDAAEAWDQLADQLQWLEKIADHTPSPGEPNDAASPDLL